MEYLFKSVGTNDFEYVLHKLNEAYKIVNVYSKELDTIAIEGAIGRDIEVLKATLISIITTSNPKNPQTIDEEQYQACWQFLSLFEKYYSFNYDLILYWVFMHFIDSGKSLKCNDGFNYYSEIDNIVTYNIEGSNDQNIYYLHGALHIFDNGEKIEKFTWNNTNISIKEQVEEALSKNKYPIFITEGSAKHKINRISNNAYLASGFRSLKNITGNLFIHGHSLRDEDDHVFDIINSINSDINNIFISIFGEKSSKNNKRIIDKIAKWQNIQEQYKNKKTYNKKYKNYYIYQAETANVWNYKLVSNV